MKKSFLSIATLSLLMLLASCNNLLNQENQNNQIDGAEKGSFVISLNLQAQAQPSAFARTVSPTGDKTYLDVEEWEFTCTDQDDPAFVIKQTFPVEEGKIKASLPLGHVYDVVLAGALQNEFNEKVVFTNKTPVEIDLKNQESITTPVYVTVDLAKTPTGEGNLHYVVTMAGDLSGKTPSYMLRLCEPGTEGRVVLYQYTSSTGDSEKDIEDGKEKDKAYILSYLDGVLEINHKIKSGFYDLYIYQSGDSNDFTAGKRIFTGENLIEIADDITTFANVTGTVLKRKTFYATTEPSDYSGNSPSYPININTLLSKLDDYQDEEIDINFEKGTNLREAGITFPIFNKSVYAYIDGREFYRKGYDSYFTISENGDDNTGEGWGRPFKTIGGAMDFISSYLPLERVPDKELNLKIDGEVYINDEGVLTFENYKKVTIENEHSFSYADEHPAVINGGRVEEYRGEGRGLEFRNIKNIELKNITIKDVYAGDNTAVGQCAGLRFDTSTDIERVNIDFCSFIGNTRASIADSLFFYGTNAKKRALIFISSCNFNSNASLGGNDDSGVIRLLDTNAYVSVYGDFTGNNRADIYVSGNDDVELYLSMCEFNDNTSTVSELEGVNVVYKSGKLGLRGSNYNSATYKIKVGDGKTVNVKDVLNSGDLITLIPENYAQSEPILSFAEELNPSDWLGNFTLADERYTISEDGYVESELVKHITPTNYGRFTKDKLKDGMTLVIHSGFYPIGEDGRVTDDTILTNFFRTLIGHGLSDITIDMSGCEDEVWRYLRFEDVPTKVILPNNLSNWYLQTFENSINLKEIVIDSSNEKYMTIDGVLYEKGADGNPVALVQYPAAKEGETYTFPPTVTKFNGSGVFANTQNLKTITNFDQITDLGSYGSSHFYKAQVMKLVFNDAITRIPDSMFLNSAIEEVVLPAQLKTIEERAFVNCGNLKSVTFRNSNPPELKVWDVYYQFKDCPILEQINVPGTDLSVVSAYQAALPETVRSKVALYLPTGDSINVTEALTDGFIITPESYDYSYPIITFADGVDPTTNLEKIHLSDSTYHIDETGRIASALRKTVTLANWESEFESWSELTEGMTLVIDSSMAAAEIEVEDGEKIPVATEFFYGLLCGNDKCITLDLSSYRADSYSKLSFMDSAEKIILPDTLEDLCYDAFDSEQQLYEIEISENNPNYVTIEGVLYKKDASGNPSVIVRYPPAKYGDVFTLPSTVTSIGQAAFANATSLEYVTNFNQITKCEDSSRDHFRGSAVSSIELGENLTELGTAMFRECRYISSITIPAGVIKINAYCFESCSNLTSITFESSVPPVIENTAFSGCKGLTYIYVPDSAVEAYKAVLPEERKENVRAN